MSSPLVSAIVPNWNGRDDLLECLKSLRGINYPNLEIIVVDNASTDNSVDTIKGMLGVKIVENKQNLGYAGGCNAGLEVASGDYLLFMNNDVIVDQEFLTELINVAERDHRIGICGPKVYNYYRRNELWYAGGEINLQKGLTREFGVFEQDRGQYDVVRSVNFVPGCAMLVRKPLIDAIGTFDPQYFMYFEDADLCLRALRAGFEILYVPRSKVWHKVSATAGYVSPLSFYYSTRNRITLEERYASDVQKLIFLAYFLYESVLFFGYCIVRHRQELLQPYFKGLLWHLRPKGYADVSV